MDNRKKILEVALNLFSLRGYDAVGIQEITEAAGITKPTMYHYFGSKKGLLEIILEENFNELLRDLRDSVIYDGDLPLTLEKTVRVFFAFASKNQTFYRMQLAIFFASSESEAMKAVAPYNERIFKLLEKLFLQASNDHGNMKGRHIRYAVTFLGMINNYIGLSINGFFKLDENTIRDAVHQFSHGIYS